MAGRNGRADKALDNMKKDYNMQNTSAAPRSTPVQSKQVGQRCAQERSVTYVFIPKGTNSLQLSSTNLRLLVRMNPWYWPAAHCAPTSKASKSATARMFRSANVTLTRTSKRVQATVWQNCNLLYYVRSPAARSINESRVRSAP